jgi:transposase
MPSALLPCIRQQIVEQKSRGLSLLDIAEQNHLSYSTVRNIYKRYKTQGIQGLKPLYNHCHRPGPKPDALHYRAAVWLKRRHSDWGAAFIIVKLQQRYTDMALPTERTLQRWFKAQGLSKTKSCFALAPPAWANEVHEVWQIDAKEQLQLTSGEKACYLSIVDEKSGCLLKAAVFPPVQYQ